MSTQLTTEAKSIEVEGGALQIHSLQDAVNFGRLAIQSGMAPASYTKPEQVVIAVQYGSEIGLKPLQSLQAIAVINGRPALWGDGLLALVRQSPLCEYVHESYDPKTRTATCRAKRKGEPDETVRTFNWSDAELAKLTGKQPWRQYPQRMLQMRARSWCLRDLFADLLCGFAVAEELNDIPTEEVLVEGQTLPMEDLDDVAGAFELESKPVEQELKETLTDAEKIMILDAETEG